MQMALNDEHFRQRVTEFIKCTIHTDIDNKTSEEIMQITKRQAVSYSRPISSDATTEEYETEEKILARTIQYHKCNTATCLQLNNGRYQCKRKAPFAISPHEWVNSDGEWGPKRFCPNLNNWNPWIMHCIRANHDVKSIMNGGETSSCVLVLYTTNYAFKKQNRSGNASALIAERLAFHQKKQSEDSTDVDDPQYYNKQLLQRCANALLTQREFSRAEIVSYLMGWGDRFESHDYLAFYMNSAILAVKRAYPHLMQR